MGSHIDHYPALTEALKQSRSGLSGRDPALQPKQPQFLLHDLHSLLLCKTEDEVVAYVREIRSALCDTPIETPQRFGAQETD